jgi:hypothetical protein
MLEIFKEVHAWDICRFALSKPVLGSFVKKVNKLFCICIAGYALLRVIHHFQSKIIFHLNPNLYTEWLGTVDRQYLAYLSDLNPRPPPTPSVGNNWGYAVYFLPITHYNSS